MKINDYTSAEHIIVHDYSSVGDECFSSYNNLLTITFPETLVSIGNNIIQNTKITDLYLPKNVKTLHIDQSFDKSYSINRIIVSPENPYFCDVDGVLYSKNKKILYFYPGNRTENPCIVLHGVTNIKRAAFSLSINHKTIVLPSSINLIEDYFLYCSYSIEKVIIMQCPEKVKIQKYQLLAGTSKKEEDIIEYKYSFCYEEVIGNCVSINSKINFQNILFLIHFIII